ncbi:hypothetical protein BN59_03387 [Legionella massiliensis]|uniref:Zinc resistance-associated protein n=1 Tax=Legionella massiliensis TaxID=1034943 RepID=A0A078L1I8_9GAMM|nr:hypothetical protein [Legionella massiliensis]CDZ79071.1 hypothetical protein BN59_03387 [Legionella massiliensis]CEE14809.1 hypothetical protein BN1094_03387 [Legionella massiliensis]
MFKKLLITSILGASVLTASVVMAEQTENTGGNLSQVQKIHKNHGYNKLLTAQQNNELREIMKGLREQMAPLIKEKIALKMQLKGKIATPQTQWSDISKLVEQINENNAKITALIARTQLTTFQKLGVLIPMHNPRFHGAHHGFKISKG